MTAKSTKIPKIRTFKMTACEVTDKINSILKSNSESKVLKVTTPENGCSTLSIEFLIVNRVFQAINSRCNIFQLFSNI